MGRLVDIEDVKDFINGLDSLPWEEEVDDLVKLIPTAYDKKKVIKALDNAESVKVFGSLNSGNRLIPVQDAIDIVKAGGVE